MVDNTYVFVGFIMEDDKEDSIEQYVPRVEEEVGNQPKSIPQK